MVKLLLSLFTWTRKNPDQAAAVAKGAKKAAGKLRRGKRKPDGAVKAPNVD